MVIDIDTPTLGCMIMVNPSRTLSPIIILFSTHQKAGSISRADVADFILGAVSEEDFPYLKQAPCISSVGGTSWVKDRSGAARGEMA